MDLQKQSPPSSSQVDIQESPFTSLPAYNALLLLPFCTSITFASLVTFAIINDVFCSPLMVLVITISPLATCHHHCCLAISPLAARHHHLTTCHHHRHLAAHHCYLINPLCLPLPSSGVNCIKFIYFSLQTPISLLFTSFSCSLTHCHAHVVHHPTRVGVGADFTGFPCLCGQTHYLCAWPALFSHSALQQNTGGQS
jgi:hypothetical protein